MNRLEELTRGLRDDGIKPVVPFLTAGYPDPEGFREVMAALAAAGCPLMEIGVPFSDPVADGPVIQAASQRALAGGMSLAGSLRLAASAGRDHGLAVVLMGYLNPILRMGPEVFAAACDEAGVAGVIVPDLPLEEAAGLRALLHGVGVDLVSLVAPTTDDARLQQHAAASRGFLYLVSTTGVTGAGAGTGDQLESHAARVRAASDLPLYVGFGVSRPEQAARIAGLADGAIVGSALIRILADDGPDLDIPTATRAHRFIGGLWAAMNPERGAQR